MVDRVEVFVDTSYLLASFYNSWTTGARAQLEIDLPAVTDHLNTIVSNKLHLPVHRQLWYDGIPTPAPTATSAPSATLTVCNCAPDNLLSGATAAPKKQLILAL